MAKQNRRINIAKREARELRKRLFEAQELKHHAERRERDAVNDLHSLERRLRAFCHAFFLLKPEGFIGPRDYLTAPQTAREWPRHYADEYSRNKIEHTRAIELVHMIISASPAEGFPDFRRFVHFRVTHPAGPDFRLAYAVSREVLKYHRLGAEHLTEDLLRQFGSALCEAIKKSSR